MKFQKDDFEDYYRLVSNESVMAQITERAIPLEEARSNYEKVLLSNKRSDLLGSYKIMSEDQFLGLGHVTLKEAYEAEIGYMLLPPFWGRGYGTEVARMLIELAEQTDVKKLMATIDPNNIASRKILVNQQFVSEKVCEIDGLPGEILSRRLSESILEEIEQ